MILEVPGSTTDEKLRSWAAAVDDTLVDIGNPELAVNDVQANVLVVLVRLGASGRIVHHGSFEAFATQSKSASSS